MQYVRVSALALLILVVLLVVPSAGMAADMNVAAGKLPTASSGASDLVRVTDGDLTASSYAGLASGAQWIKLDLGQRYAISRVDLWHYYGDGRTYKDVIVQLSDSADFSSGVTTIFNNDKDNTAGQGVGSHAEYAESSSGKSIPLATVINARYVRLWSNGSNKNAWNHYVETRVYGSIPSTDTNVAAGKLPTASSGASDLARVTDGDLTASNYAGLASGTQWIKLDLGQRYAISKVELWHYHGDGRTYKDVIVQLSDSADFSSGVTTIFNNDTDNTAGQGAGSHAEYAESSSGKSITLPTSVNARYVRLWSNGSNKNAWNHYVETRIYGSAPAGSSPLLEESFTAPDDSAFVTSSAFWNSSDDGLWENDRWFAEGGSMYHKSNTGWTNHAGFFRMWTRQTDLADTRIQMDVRFNGWSGGSEGWHGINLWMNRKLVSGSKINDGAQEGYIVDFMNRDGKIYLGKKVGDTYYFTASRTWAPTKGTWYRWAGQVTANADGSRTVRIIMNGSELLKWTDNGSIGGPPLKGGRAGLRSDYADFNIDNLTIARP